MRLPIIVFILLLFTGNAFAQQNVSNDPPFSFQKVFYGRAGSGMIIADYRHVQFQIDSSGRLLFSCIPGKGALNGTYSGQLSPAQLTQLNALIKKCNPEQFVISHQKVMDVPGYTFRFYYNNKMKEDQGQMLPRPAIDLSNFLESLTGTLKLERITYNYGLDK
ncbi:MAG: hypothetical protein ACHQD8_01720 [Chitinophagales bacterium]